MYGIPGLFYDSWFYRKYIFLMKFFQANYMAVVNNCQLIIIIIIIINEERIRVTLSHRDVAGALYII